MSDPDGGPDVGGDHGHAPGHQPRVTLGQVKGCGHVSLTRHLKLFFHEDDFPKIKSNFLFLS